MDQLGRIVKKGKPFANLENSLLNLHLKHWHRKFRRVEGKLLTSTSSNSTRVDRLPESGIDSSNDDNTGSVAKTSSLRVSSKGSTISTETLSIDC
jgi:hypothetical protein